MPVCTSRSLQGGKVDTHFPLHVLHSVACDV
ncbi:hypothetical protein TPASS_0932 [Treponema pallidum subsp. pallidum SS14]|uniref:Uncharacterized protein TP_0932 n=2 Tax=Treponema pallidum subsp. pallidum TaxID=161 RepID=Y932_TREPA|nr:RecName: Full=Uncharacterized protein TP_0932 [Treponema pallidum subsp. pallidum str. Nichols]AAC65890.1 predicted coding region TP0932 [Treponema pallidum subsp. pallidum str. Nichols]ACD71348.1 hypothetical protein TPASS_0932 [Treponema pallidum subsp. pallidum SS14]